MLETIFSACGYLAMLGWLSLVLLPGKRLVVEVICRLVIPGLIGLVYIYVMVTHAGTAPPEGGFGSLAQVKALFTVDGLLLAGWIHYLAFDLFVGSWIVSDSRSQSIHHLIIVPVLFATFMAGPAGLVGYLLIRSVATLVAKRRQEVTA